jgi:CheY-like chemotaxis protein
MEVVAAGGMWLTLVDPPQLENALLNLCINARDAMPDGGRLTIATSNAALDVAAARQRDLPPGQYVLIRVTDTGTGMAPEVIARAFDPFFTTKPSGQGTGLGLSMIYGFARQSAGQVRIDSAIGRGTSICLYLPRYLGSETDAAVATPSEAASGGGRNETLLVVEDELTIRMFIVDVLEEAGYVVIEARDGPGALEVLRSDADISLLITDLGLSGEMDGSQIADAGRELRPNLKVLYITGYAESGIVDNIHLDRGTQILTKPFAIDVLDAKVRDMLDG